MAGCQRRRSATTATVGETLDSCWNGFRVVAQRASHTDLRDVNFPTAADGRQKAQNIRMSECQSARVDLGFHRPPRCERETHYGSEVSPRAGLYVFLALWVALRPVAPPCCTAAKRHQNAGQSGPVDRVRTCIYTGPLGRCTARRGAGIILQNGSVGLFCVGAAMYDARQMNGDVCAGDVSAVDA